MHLGKWHKRGQGDLSKIKKGGAVPGQRVADGGGPEVHNEVHLRAPVQLGALEGLRSPAPALDLATRKELRAPEAAPFHLHMFRQFCAEPAKNDLAIGGWSQPGHSINS